MINEEIIRCMLESQGYMVKIGKTEEPLTAETMPAKSQKNQSRYQELRPPEPGTLKMQIPSDLVPHCLKCGRPMTMNLRCDDTFVQDEGWHRASQRYAEFCADMRECSCCFWNWERDTIHQVS